MCKRFHQAAPPLALLLVGTLTAAYAQTYTVLHEFTGADGRSPSGTLTLASTNLYGTACDFSVQGSLFRIGTDGSGFTVLHRFYEVEGCGGLVLSGSTLYGTTFKTSYITGSGTIFRLNTDGTGFTVLKSFTDEYPSGDLVLSGNTLFGMTSAGSAPAGHLFKINTDGTGFSVLAGGPGKRNRVCALSGSQLYGIASWLGFRGGVFSINTNGTALTTLKSFGQSDPGSPVALLLSGSTLYGQADSMLFKLNVDGSGYASQSIAGSFFGDLAICGSTLYAARQLVSLPNWSQIFQIQTDLTNFAVLKQSSQLDGYGPRGGLVTSGTALYGTTRYGGSYDLGVVYRLCFLGIQRSPLGRMAAIGSTVTMSAEVIGTPPFAYQWFFNGTNLLTGSTNTSLTLANLQAPQTGAYTLVVTNSFGTVTSAPAMLEVVESVHSTITNCTEAALRSALISGGKITFACDGTIILNNTLVIANDTLLDAGAHQVTLDGARAQSTLFVPADITFAAANLTFANGLNTNGGAIYNQGGILNLTNCSFTGNRALGAGSSNFLDPDGKPARGGAIYNAGVLTAIRCRFSGNSACGGDGYSPVEGWRAGRGGSAEGAALYNLGSFRANQCEFSHNTATGGAPGPNRPCANPDDGAGGDARGAICNQGALFIESSLFAYNAALAGAGKLGISSYCPASDCIGGGPGGRGGPACGAVFALGPSAFVNCTFTGNTAQGGAGGAGGNGGCFINMGTGETFYGDGGPGGIGGEAQAVLYDPAGLARLTNCTIALNTSAGGAGGIPGRKVNAWDGGPAAASGFAAGALLATNAVLVNTVLAINAPTNCSGTLIDAGHNLSSDGSCAFSGAGSLNQTDPKLGPLVNNGGPTPTMALLPGSPAIDAGDPSFSLPIDQRGLIRPIGASGDIGAYEYGSPAYLQPNLAGNGGMDILATGVKGQPCCLLVSTNLTNWLPVATGQFGPEGTVLFHTSGGASPRYYRAILLHMAEASPPAFK